MNVTVSNMGLALPKVGRLGLLCLCFALVSPTMQAQTRDYYRYRNADGAMVISDVLTQAALDAGYLVTDRMGRIKERVPPRPTAEEIAERKRKRAEAKRLQAEAAQQALYDEQLLRRYSRPEELEAARERAIEQIQLRIDILKSNRQSVVSAIEEHQAEAADLLRLKGEAPQDLLDNIALLREELMETQRQIRSREEELRARSEQFDFDRARLEHLHSRAFISESGLLDEDELESASDKDASEIRPIKDSSSW